MNKKRPGTKEQLVKDYVILKIVSNIYRPGEAIPPEAELSKRLGVSRITIRNALHFLSHNNWLESYQGKGYFVADNGWINVVSPKSSLKAKSKKVTWKTSPSWVHDYLIDSKLADSLTYEERFLDDKNSLCAISFGAVSHAVAQEIQPEDIEDSLTKWLRYHNVDIKDISQDLKVIDLPDQPEWSELAHQLGYPTPKAIPAIFVKGTTFANKTIFASVLLLRKEMLSMSRTVQF